MGAGQGDFHDVYETINGDDSTPNGFQDWAVWSNEAYTFGPLPYDHDLFGTKLSCLFVLAASFLSTISGSLTELGRSGILGGGVYLVTLSFSFTKSIKSKNPSCTYISTTSCLYEPLSVRSGILELGPLEGNQGYWQSHT